MSSWRARSALARAAARVTSTKQVTRGLYAADASAATTVAVHGRVNHNASGTEERRASPSGSTGGVDAAIDRGASASTKGRKLIDTFPKDVVDDIYRGSFRSQTGVSLKYMMDFGAQPIHRQMMVSAQFLRNELPVRLAHRVAELENLPFGLSDMSQVLDVRDWYVESFRELRSFPEIESMDDEEKFTNMLKRVMLRHENVVPMIARAVLELKDRLSKEKPRE